MTVNVSPTTSIPTHHIKLSDGVNEVGLILRSGNRVDPRAINRRPRQNGQYSPFTQSDWGSGRGIKDAAADRSRFADSKRAITRHPGQVMIGGQETFTTGYRQAEQYMPGSLTWVSLLTTNRYIAYNFTASATGNRSAVSLWIRRRGTPTSTLTVELCANDTDKPGTVLKTVTKTTTNITDTISELIEFVFSSVQAVTATTTYWIKIYTSTADSTTNYWQVGTDALDMNNKTKISSDGTTWGAAAYDLYFRIVDDTDLLGGFFFKYFDQLYFLTRQSGATAPKLYMNGYRGVATGTHSLTTLQDTTQTFTAGALIGATILIISGTNSEWQTPYRIITDNDANTITFDAFPKAPVSASTIYVIIGSNVWTEITGHGLTVLPTSVSSAGEVCYFAQGDKTKMRRMREYLNNVTWTREFAEEDNYAKFLLDFRHPTRGLMVCKVNDNSNFNDPIFSYAKAEGWGRRLNYSFLINDCEATTGFVAGTNGTVAVDNTIFVNGTKSIKLTLSGAPGSPILYYPLAMNATTANAIRFWVRSDANRAAGDLKVFLSTSATAASQLEILSVPAIRNGEWQLVELPYNNATVGTAVVLSIGFQTLSTTNSYWIDSIELIVKGSEVPLGNRGEKITGMELYGDPETPWVFRTQSAGSIENGIFSPIPLRELSTAESVYNGVGHTVHNVYLYFSFLHGIERFYRNNLDDIGPNRDEGMPVDRRGYVTSMVGYIGRFFYNYDVQEGYSCIMESTSGSDHHEVYRADTPGDRIRRLFVQVIPGESADRLWFTVGENIAWIYLPGNTLKENTDDTFRHTQEAVLETGWLYGTETDAVKIFHSIKAFFENATSARNIEVDYKTDDNTTWVAASSSFTTPPVQEIVLNVSAKRIKFRFRLQTNNNTETPLLKQIFISATSRPETRWTYSMTCVLDDFPIDLQGNQDTSLTATEVLTQLDAWMEANTILTMSSVFTPYHNKQVIIEPVVTQPVTLVIDESQERLMATIVLLEP